MSVRCTTKRPLESTDVRIFDRDCGPAKNTTKRKRVQGENDTVLVDLNKMSFFLPRLSQATRAVGSDVRQIRTRLFPRHTEH